MDIDSGERVYTVETPEGPKPVAHDAGAMATFGIPADKAVWKSVEYEGATYKNGEEVFVDARGRTADGKRWRYVGKFAESASYRDADDITAPVLDRVLDAICILASAR